MRDESRNIGVLAPPTMGGSWHNNHHARPGLAQTRRHWWQLDLAGEFIRLLDHAGLVRNVRYVNSSDPSRGGSMKAGVNNAARSTTDESLVRAIVQLDPRSARAKRVVALVTIGVPTVGFAIAIYLMVTGRATALDYTLFLVFYAIHIFGITIGYHRYAAHKSFKTSPFFEGVLMITGRWRWRARCCTGWPPTAVITGSPTSRGTRIRRISAERVLAERLKGLWYAHIPWMLSDQESRVNVFAPDVLRDQRLYVYSRTYPVWALAGLLAAGRCRLGHRRHARGRVLRLHLRRPGAGVRCQSGHVVRRIDQPHDRLAAVRQP